MAAPPTSETKVPKQKTRPSFLEMAREAIINLADKKGATVPAIQAYIEETYSIDMDTSRHHLKAALAKGLTTEVLVRPKGSEAKGFTGRFKINKVKLEEERKAKAKKAKKMEEKAKSTANNSSEKTKGKKASSEKTKKTSDQKKTSSKEIKGKPPKTPVKKAKAVKPTKAKMLKSKATLKTPKKTAKTPRSKK